MAKKIPIKAVKDFANKYGYDQIIIIGFDQSNDTTSVATYGKTAEDCAQSATAGNFIKEEILNWPKNLCKAEPNRIKKMKNEITRLKSEITILKAKS
jgi:hypothetical protein